MDKYSTPPLSLLLVTPGYPRRSGGVGGHAGVAIVRASSPSGEKMRKPLNSVKLSQIEDPSERLNSLDLCGKTRLNPGPAPMPLNTRFWAIRPMK